METLQEGLKDLEHAAVSVLQGLLSSSSLNTSFKFFKGVWCYCTHENQFK